MRFGPDPTMVFAETGRIFGFACDFTQSLDATVEQRQRRTFRGEEQCGPPPYPRRCTGNYDVALLQATSFGHLFASSLWNELLSPALAVLGSIRQDSYGSRTKRGDFSNAT